jgi:Subunit ChlI of Mg-chelatase
MLPLTTAHAQLRLLATLCCSKPTVPPFTESTLYRVEVEVDVGSAKMTDFNVVGLPDNAVKESHERIKSAMRNCGFEFPPGQGVTINLASADVRKEGSAFDLPMALGLVGCMAGRTAAPQPTALGLSRRQRPANLEGTGAQLSDRHQISAE